MTSVFEQHGYGVRLEWGAEGIAALAPVCAVVVVVDVLSFSTAVDVAVGRGAAVLPLRWAEDATAPAGAVLAGRRGGRSWSLSPSSLLRLPAGTRLALPSPNGATLSAAATGHRGTVVLAGCLRNASEVAARAVTAAGSDGVIGVIPAGERWPDGRLRPAVEDLIGAGAVVAALDGRGPRRRDAQGPQAQDRDTRSPDAQGPEAQDRHARSCSPEALAAADAFRAAHARGLEGMLAGCVSGRELASDGYAADVALAAAYDVSSAAPVLRDGEYRA